MNHIVSLGETVAMVSEIGGTIVRFQHQGWDIFHPAERPIKGKLRGGCHVCAPWFGSSDMGEKKHGHVRDLEAESAHPRPNAMSADFRRLGDERYPYDLEYLTKTIVQASGLLQTGITIRNVGDRDAPVDPAFHPYFECPPTGDPDDIYVVVNGRREKGFSDKARFIEIDGREKIIVSMPDRWIEMQLGGAFLRGGKSSLYLWSDSPQRYICVEPVLYEGERFNTSRGLTLGYENELDISMSLNVTIK